MTAFRPIPAAGIAVNALAIYAAIRPADVPILLLGAAVFANAGLVAYDAFRRPGDPRALSPAFLLGIMVLVFYVVCPGIYLLTGPTNQIPRTIYDMWIAYNGSHAEYLVLQFSALLFLFVSVFPVPATLDDVFTPMADPAARRRTVAACLAAAFAVSAFKFLEAHGLDPFGFRSGAGAQLWAAALPVALFGLTASVLFAAEETFRIRAAVLLGAAACFGIHLVSDLARLPVALFAFLALSIFVLRKYRLGRILNHSLLIAGLIVALTAAAATYRKARHEASFGIDFVNNIPRKLLWRQTVSAWCLEEARNRHWEADGTGSYRNLVSGLVPRFLWADKPNLSRGAYYAVEYCRQQVTPSKPHSEALTLLAEPLMEGGREGLFVGEAILLAFLGAATWLMFRLGPAGLVSGIAMLPWLTGVEQHMSYYLANCVKMALFILPFALALHWYVRRAERKRAA